MSTKLFCEHFSFDLTKNATATFLQIFGGIIDDCVVVSAPGRVNLIGEHTDYNDGFVLPLALELKTIMIGRIGKLNKCRIVSSSMDNEVVEFSGDGSIIPGEPSWANYVKGVVCQYLGSVPGHCISFDAAIVSDIPIGAGLSSSAALEVATATLIEALYSLNISPEIKALRCVACEREYCHMPCGIMDQYVSACGYEGSALLIDCRSQRATKVPLDDESVAVVVTNSHVQHKLVGSEYPDRVNQCKEAVLALQKSFPGIVALRDATIEQLEKIRGEISNVIYRRARHVISENERTLVAVGALLAHDYMTFGRCMVHSHRSLRDDYEVSTPELDELVKIAMSVPGVFGSRMTGGGFGGCTVTLVKRDAIEMLISAIEKEYVIKTRLTPTCFVSVASAGAQVIRDHRNNVY